MSESGDWFVYIIHCSDDSLYTGITTDLSRRFDEHLNLHDAKKGAKYFRGRTPLKIVYQESGHTRSSASKQEIHIKRMSRKAKLVLTELPKTPV